MAELPDHRPAPGAQRHRHLGDHVLHLLLEPVPLLPDPLRAQDQDRAGGGLQLHLLRQDRLGGDRRRRDPDRPAGFGLRLLRAQVHRPGADDGRAEGLRVGLQCETM